MPSVKEVLLGSVKWRLEDIASGKTKQQAWREGWSFSTCLAAHMKGDRILHYSNCSCVVKALRDSSTNSDVLQEEALVEMQNFAKIQFRLPCRFPEFCQNSASQQKLSHMHSSLFTGHSPTPAANFVVRFGEEHRRKTELVSMMMIAFITIKSILVPLIEDLCAQIYFRYQISVVLLTSSSFLFCEKTTLSVCTMNQVVQQSLNPEREVANQDWYLSHHRFNAAA